MTKQGTQLSRLLYLVTWVLLGLIALGMVAAVVALGITLVSPETWPSGATFRVNGTVVPGADAMQARTAMCVMMLATLALAMAILVPLKGLVRSAMDGTPFLPVNVRRLRAIAVVFAIVAVARVVLPLMIPAGTVAGRWLEGPTVDLGPLVMALIVLVLAEVFREGVRLHDEAEGTI